jgi:hypothetical protein
LTEPGTATLGGSGGGGVMRRCSIVLSWLSQNDSRSSVSGSRLNTVLTVHGLIDVIAALALRLDR